MENEKTAETVLPKKSGKKKRGKVAKIYKMHQEGKSVKEIAEKTGTNERLVRSYIWRASNPEKYRQLLQRYFEKKRQKRHDESAKEAANNSH